LIIARYRKDVIARRLLTFKEYDYVAVVAQTPEAEASYGNKFDYLHAVLGESRTVSADTVNPILLTGFFNRLRSASFEPLTSELPKPQLSPIDEDSLGGFIKRLYSPLQNLRAAGRLCNPWQAARVGRDEVRNTAVLSWLLDPAGDHGLGGLLLSALLARVHQIQDHIPDAAAGSVRVTREAVLGDDGANRVDIEVRCHDVHKPFYLLIEAKVGAREGAMQIPRYIALAQAGAGALPWAILYLTLHGRDARRVDDCDYSQVLALSWKDLARLLLRALRNMEPSQPAFQGFSYQLAETYLRHVRAL
jgi:hypothetical protein